MSGVSDVTDCPCCRSEKSMMVSSDWKPHDCVNGVCLVCGYEYWTELGFADKEYLEELRHDYDFKESIEITEEKKGEEKEAKEKKEEKSEDFPDVDIGIDIFAQQ